MTKGDKGRILSTLSGRSFTLTRTYGGGEMKTRSWLLRRFLNELMACKEGRRCMRKPFSDAFRQVSLGILSTQGPASMLPVKRAECSCGVAGIVGRDVRADTTADSQVEPSVCSPVAAMPCCGRPSPYRRGVSGSARD